MPVGPVTSTGGVICEDRGRVWLLGFATEEPTPGPRELLLAEGRITESHLTVLHHSYRRHLPPQTSPAPR